MSSDLSALITTDDTIKKLVMYTFDSHFRFFSFSFSFSFVSMIQFTLSDSRLSETLSLTSRKEFCVTALLHWHIYIPRPLQDLWLLIECLSVPYVYISQLFPLYNHPSSIIIFIFIFIISISCRLFAACFRLTVASPVFLLTPSCRSLTVTSCHWHNCVIHPASPVHHGTSTGFGT